MAPSALKSDRLIMYIGVTSRAFFPGLLENQGFVTHFTIKQLMLSD
jgi:hypothetical protein